MPVTTLGVRLEEEEKRLLEEIAQAQGRTVSDVVRDALQRLTAAHRAVKTVQDIHRQVEAEFAERLGALNEAKAALESKERELSARLLRLIEAETELLRREEEEQDPEAAAELLEQAAKLKLVREATSERLEEVRVKIRELDGELSKTRREQAAAKLARLRQAFPEIAEPLFDVLISDLDSLFTLLHPYLQAVYEVERRPDVLKWLRLRVSEALRARNADACELLGAKIPLTNPEKFRSWPSFWEFWRQWVR